MKKMIVFLFALMFVLTAGCALFIRDIAHNDHGNNGEKDGRHFDQAQDERGNMDGNRDDENSSMKKRKHKSEESDNGRDDSGGNYRYNEK